MTRPAHLRILLRALVLSALCTVASGGHTLAQNGSVSTSRRPAVVWGTVVDAAEARPLAGVAIALAETGGRARYSTQTDSAGMYRISAPTGAHYRLVARHPGYEPDSIGFRLSESTMLSMELEVRTIGAAPFPATARQRGVIAGRATDASTNLPLPEVAVTVEGTVYTGRTDAQGQFRIPGVPAGRVQVRAGRVGYDGRNQTATVVAGQTATANFSLSASALGLDELVVTATGREERKREIGNVVTTIETEQVEMAPVTNLSNLLQGRAPGVTVLPSSGTLGTGNRIQIRGASSVSLVGTPLIIIDGIRTNNDVEASSLWTGGQSASRVEDINPEDIETIEILKGPAASARYGTAAANGVIQITTKRGRRGTSQLRAFVQRTTSEIIGSQIPSNYLARGLNGQGQRVNCSFVERAAGICVGLPDSVYQYNPLLQAPNSPLRTGQVNKYGASISGGSSDGAITYYVSGEADEGTGTVRYNEIDRVNFRANVASRLSEKFRFSASTGFISNFIQLPQGDNSSSGVFLNALRGSPTPANIQAFSGFNPPYNPSNVSAWGNEQDLRRFIGSANAEYRPLSWLSFNAVAGVDQSNRFERSFVDAGGLPNGTLLTGLREQYRLQQSEFTANLNGNMVHEFGRVTSTTSGGVQYNESVFDGTYAAGTNITPGTKSATEPLGPPQEGAGGNKLFGILLSQQFGFADRFFVTGAIRGDQSSTFGENIGLITYPAVSASWVLLEEPWFPEVDVLSHLRLRAAYGESGRPPGRQEAIRTFTDRAAAIEGGIVPGYVTSRLGNVDLKAEITSETEFGADVGLFDDRLALEVTRFSKNTEDALVRRPLPPSLGGPVNQYFNLGEVENKGWEGSVRLEPIRTERFDLNLRFNFGTTQNKLVSLGDTTIPPIVIGYQRHVPGYPLAGYWESAYTFEDTNGDGLIQRSEVTRRPRVCRPTDPATCVAQDDTVFNTSFAGSAFPTREMSFNGTANLFGIFRVSGLLDYKGGHKLFNAGRRMRCADSNTLAFCEERQVPGAASLEQQAAIQARQANISSAGFYEDADFWKLRELSLTASVPQSLVRRIRAADGLSITLSGRNLKTWTSYGGPDPEVGYNRLGIGDDPGRQFVADLLTLPAPRMFVVRVDASF